MDYLALIFDRSKSSIHQAIKDKEAEAKAIIEESKLRNKAKKIALEQLIEEEKQKLKQSRQIEQTNTQRTTEEGIIQKN
jgi:deoxyribose-phosphate aldolase